MRPNLLSSSRRQFIKRAGALGLAGAVPLLLPGCGGSDDDGGGGGSTPLGEREARHLHFDLSMGAIAEARLALPHSAHHGALLQAHTASSREKHRELNPLLADIDDAKLTHYIEDVDLPAQALQLITIRGVHPTTRQPLLAGHSIHVPTSALQSVAARRASRDRPGARALSAKMLAYGVRASALDAAPIASQVAFNAMPWDVAVWMVFSNPAITNIDPELGAEILDRIQSLPPCDPNNDSCTPFLGTLAFQIANLIGADNFPSTTPSQSWATLIPVNDPATGLPAIDADGFPVCRYEIDPSLADAARQASAAIINDINNDPLFMGTNWQARDGGVVPESQPAQLRSLAATGSEALAVVSGAAMGSRLSGIRFYETEATAERALRVTVRNEFIRSAGAYVEYLDANENSLPVANQVDGEDTSRAKRIRFIAPAIAILGIPLQGTDQPATELNFTMPDDASHARLYFGGLGTGGDAFTPEAVAASVMTLIMNLGFPALCLAAGIFPDGEKLLKNTLTDILEDPIVAKDIILELAGSSLKEGIYSTIETSNPRGFLVEMADTVMDLFLKHAPRFAALLAGVIVAETAEKAIPIVGQLLWGLGELADVVTIGETLIEVLACKAVQTNTISLQMTTTVRIGRDPKDYQFPASARKYRVNAYYDGGKTPRVIEGTVAQGQVDPIDVVFDGVPSGGKVSFEVFFQSDADCLVGVVPMTSAIRNLPDSAGLVPLTLTELLVPLDATTTYQHSLKLGWQDGHRQWLTGAAAPAAAALCAGDDGAICQLNGLTVHTSTGMAGYGFNAGGQNVTLCSGGSADSMNTFQNVFLGKNPETGIKFSGCGYTQPVGLVYATDGPAAGGNNFFLQPDPNGKYYHLRGVDLTAGAGFDLFQRVSWGRFSSPLDSLAVTRNGYVVGVNRSTHKMYVLQLPQAALDDDTTVASLAVPFSSTHSGKGSAVGLMDTPVAVASYSTAVLVLEQGNARVQAFDHSGNEAVKLFVDKNGAKTALMTLFAEAEGTSATYLDLAVEGVGYIYVLSHVGDGDKTSDYRLDLYTPTGSHLSRTVGLAAGAIAVDLFRNVYSLNYEVLTGSPRVEPSLSQWLPVSTTPCPTTLPASAASATSARPMAACAAPALLHTV